MSSNSSSQTGSLCVSDALNEARIQGDETKSLILFSTQTKKKRSQKHLLSQIDDFDYRKSLSQLINSLEAEQNIITPQSKKLNRKAHDHTKTMTIKNKKGKLYDQICPICLSEFSKQEAVLNCKHKFCYECIKSWSSTSTVCPCCRKKFKSIAKILDGNKEEIMVEEKNMEFKEEDYYVCYVCGRGDHENVLFICDMCDFYCCHIFCDPTLNNIIPEGDWYCRNCRSNANFTQLSNLSEISSIPSHNQQQENNEQQQKPIAQRTRSRNIEQTQPAAVLRVLRRRR